MAFDPDKYIAEKTGSTFDPDKYIAEKTGAEPEKPQTGIISQIERGLTENEQKVGQQLAQPERYPPQHVIQGATGVLNQAGAVVGPPLKEAAIGLIGGLTPEERAIGKRSIASLVNPVVSDVKKAAGTIMSGMPAVQQAMITQSPYGVALKDLAGLGVGAAGVMPMAAGTARMATQGAKALDVARAGLNQGVVDVGKGLVKKATEIENVGIKILVKEAKEGAKIENFAKYELFGKPEEVVTKARAQIQDASAKLKEVISKAADDPANNVDFLEIAQNAEQRILDKTDFGRSSVKKEINNILNDVIDKYGDNATSMNLADAQLLKRSAGKKGDWFESPMGGKMADNSDIKSQVYNTIYDELKMQLEEKGGAEVKELNKIMSEIIPIERAASKRMLVSTRKNPISLDDYIGALAVGGSAISGNLLPAAIAGANVLSKSPNVAKGLYGLGKNVQKLGVPISSLKGKSILGNQRGALGGGGDVAEKVFGFTPAIKNPETGEIYTGIMGHKSILNKSVPKENYDAVWKELFKDNTGKQSDYIGFIDKQGKFIPRQEAEKMAEEILSKNTSHSLVRQFHESGNTLPVMLGLTGAVGTGGITISALANRKHKKGGK